jgi:hypothetical protein
MILLVVRLELPILAESRLPVGTPLFKLSGFCARV